ncbi:uncharacterized protein [Ambystoma mexicanum]|uniref:uncharacterized protein n=1 Tax=Ambystoma mexicanum TaxID=8296 RepID=UPI0037E90DC1
MDDILKSEVLVVVLQKSKGLPLSEFAQLFHHTHGYPFTVSRYGYRSLRQLLDDMKDVVVVAEDAMQGAVARSRCLTRLVFCLVDKSGSLTKELPSSTTHSGQLPLVERASGLPGFNGQPTKEALQNLPGQIFILNQPTVNPFDMHQKKCTPSILLPQGMGRNTVPNICPILPPNQHTSMQRVGPLIPLNPFQNCVPRAPCPLVSMSPSVQLDPKKQETNTLHCGSMQPPVHPSSTTDLNHTCEEASLAKKTSEQSVATSLYSSAVCGKKHEAGLSNLQRSPPAAPLQSPGPCLDIMNTKQACSQLSLTNSNFPHLTGESQNYPSKKRTTDGLRSIDVQPCLPPFSLSTSDFPPLTAESAKDIPRKFKATWEHTNTTNGNSATPQVLLSTSDVPVLTEEAPNKKATSNCTRAKPKRLTISPELKQNILAVLTQRPGGMPLALFKTAYLCMFNRLLPLNGYASAKELLADLEDVVILQGLGVQMLVIPKSTAVPPTSTSAEDVVFSLKEEDPSTLKQDGAGGDINKDDKSTANLNPALTSAQHKDTSGVFPTLFVPQTLPPSNVAPPFPPLPTYHEAPCLNPNYDFNPSAPVYSPYPPVCFPQFPLHVPRVARPLLQGTFPGVGVPVRHGFHLPVPSQQFMFQRCPKIPAQFVVGQAYSQPPAFAAYSLIHPPRYNPLMVTGVSPGCQNITMNSAQQLQHGVDQQSGAFYAASNGDTTQFKVTFIPQSSEQGAAEIRPQKHLPEEKEASAQETLNISLDQSKPLPPVQLVLPFCKLPKSEDPNPELSLPADPNKKPSSGTVLDATGSSEVHCLLSTESSKLLDLKQEDSIHKKIMVGPIFDSVETLKPLKASSKIVGRTPAFSPSDSVRKKPGFSTCLHSTCDSEPERSLCKSSKNKSHSRIIRDTTDSDTVVESDTLVLTQNKLCAVIDPSSRSSLSESLNDLPSMKTAAGTTAGGDITLSLNNKLAKAEGLELPGHLGKTSLEKSNVKVHPTCDPQVGILRPEKANQKTLNQPGSTNQLPVVHPTCKSATCSLRSTESLASKDQNAKGSVCKHSKGTNSTTPKDLANKPRRSPLPRSSPSKAEDVSSETVLHFPKEDLGSRSVVEPTLDCESSSCEDSSEDLDVNSTGDLSCLVAITDGGMPIASTELSDPVVGAHSQPCRIL